MPVRLRGLLVLVPAVLLAGCTTAYWDRPGASLSVLASESRNCYQSAILEESPSALATSEGSQRLLPRTEPPPALWNRAPRQAGLEHFDEQLRYERCMRRLGWQPARTGTPAL